MTDPTIPGPVILISGANRGIGAEIAREIRAHGYRLPLGARDPDAPAQTAGPEDDMTFHARFDAFEPATGRGRLVTLVSRSGKRVRNPLAGWNTTKVTPKITQPADLARPARTAIELPSTAAMAKMLVNCRLEDML